MVEITAQQAVQKIRQDEQRLQGIESQLQMLGKMLEETRVGIMTLENLPDKGAKSLVPFSGVYLSAVVDSSSVKVDVGGGTILEKSKEEAIAHLKKREEEVLSNIKQLQTMGQRIAAENAELRQKVEERIRQSQGQPDVPVISG